MDHLETPLAFDNRLPVRRHYDVNDDGHNTALGKSSHGQAMNPSRTFLDPLIIE